MLGSTRQPLTESDGALRRHRTTARSGGGMSPFQAAVGCAPEPWPGIDSSESSVRIIRNRVRGRHTCNLSA